MTGADVVAVLLVVGTVTVLAYIMRRTRPSR